MVAIAANLAKAIASAPKPVPAYTPAELAAARAAVNPSITASVAPLQAEQTQANQQTQSQGQAIQGFSTALANMLAGIAPATSQTFTDASDHQALFAKGYSDAVAHLASQGAQDSNNYIQTVGGSGSVPDEGSNLGDVLYNIGGVNPATALSTAGAAFTAAAQRLPATAGTMGLQDMLANANAGQKTSQSYADQIGALEDQRPSLMQKALTSIGNSDATAAYRASELATRNKALKDAEHKLGITNTQPDPTLSKTIGYEVDKNGAPILDKSGNKIVLPGFVQKPDGTFAKAPTATQLGAHAKSVAKRNDATAKALDAMQTWVDKQMGKRGAKQIGVKPETTTSKDPTTGQTVTKYLLPDGTYTDDPTDPNIVKKPIYDLHAKLPANDYQKVFGYVNTYLKNNLKRFDYSNTQIQSMSHSLVDNLYGAPPKAATPSYVGLGNAPATATWTGGSGG